MRFGILQGRLSPSYDGRLQFFPQEWRAEFQTATHFGFSSIEWLVDWPDWEVNPIMIPEQEKSIRQMVDKTEIPVNSICADYFMKHRLAGPEGCQSGKMAVHLVEIASRLTSQKLILIPFLEQNAYVTEEERNEVVSNLLTAVRRAESLGVRIGLETEMAVGDLIPFLDRFQSPSIGVYYDTGNCTSYGFDCPSDLRKLGRRVFGVHIKDRKVGSAQSVLLGSGDTDLAGCLAALREIRFEGVPIMQAWRGDNFLQDAEGQLHLLQKLASTREVYDHEQLQESL